MLDKRGGWSINDGEAQVWRARSMDINHVLMYKKAWKDRRKELGVSCMHNTCSLSTSCEHAMTKIST